MLARLNLRWWATSPVSCARRTIVPPKLAFVAATSYMLTRFPTSELFAAPPGLVRGGDDPYPEATIFFAGDEQASNG
jgi:hypothetical protein